jgi:hypothetical protein
LEASGQATDEPSLPYPFLDFAKATIVYAYDKRPVTSQGPRIAALRCLEAALRECGKGSRPTAVDQMVLDSAVELARKQVSAAVAYRIAGQLEYIAEMMNSKGFIKLRQRWTHGVKKPQELGSRISKEAVEARKNKLPSGAALRALAGIFFEAIDPHDVLISSYTALMLCAPERINEVLRLRRNCLVEGDGQFRGSLGLRWSGSKGFEDTTKWLTTVMSPIAREAVANIITLTTPAQKLADWYTSNPTTLYLHEGATHLRGNEVLSLAEIGLVLWGDSRATNSAAIWAQTTNKLPRQSLGGRKIFFRFEDVEQAVIEMLPKTFPYVPGAPERLCKDSMVTILVNEFHTSKAAYLCMFECVDYGFITNCFGRREERTSIFDRFNFTEDDGSSIELRSHSLRHYLNMLAQMGHLSDIERAFAAGRKDIKHNRNYDNATSDEVHAPIHQALKSGFTSELEPVTSVGRNLVTRSEFKGLSLTAAHTTDYGWCGHSFASEPCQMYRDCINCEEHECVKGDDHKEANLLKLKAETEILLKAAKTALSDEEYGADNWVKHQTQTLERVNALLTLLKDPNVQVGARIRLDVANASLIVLGDTRPIKIINTTRLKGMQ